MDPISSLEVDLSVTLIWDVGRVCRKFSDIIHMLSLIFVNSQLFYIKY